MVWERVAPGRAVVGTGLKKGTEACHQASYPWHSSHVSPWPWTIDVTIPLKTSAPGNSLLPLSIEDDSQEPLWLTCLGRHTTFLGPQALFLPTRALTHPKSHLREKYIV